MLLIVEIAMSGKRIGDAVMPKLKGNSEFICHTQSRTVVQEVAQIITQKAEEKSQFRTTYIAAQVFGDNIGIQANNSDKTFSSRRSN